LLGLSILGHGTPRDHEEILREHNISDFAKRFKKAFAKSVASGSKKETQQ